MNFDSIDRHLAKLASRSALLCDPVSMTVASAGLAGGGAVSSIIGQNTSRQMAKGTQNQLFLARQQQIAENQRRATADYIQQTSDENLKMTQEHQSLAEQKNDNTKTQRRGDAEANVAAAEGNVAGHNLAEIHSDYQQQTDFINSRLEANQQWADYQHTRDDQAYLDQYLNRATSIQPYQEQVQAPVDYFGPVFGAMGQTASAGMQAKAAFGGNPLKS